MSSSTTSTPAAAATGSLEDRLRSQFSIIHALGQISTSAGEEVLCTSGDRENRIQSSRLASAFVESDQLAKSLKLGSLRQVIISQMECSLSSSSPQQQQPIVPSVSRTDSVVQSKLWANKKGPAVVPSAKKRESGKAVVEDDGEDLVSDSLLTTTVAPSLQNALVGDSIICETTQRVLSA